MNLVRGCSLRLAKGTSLEETPSLLDLKRPRQVLRCAFALGSKEPRQVLTVTENRAGERFCSENLS